MRKLACLLVWLLVGGLASGCFVLEELDEAKKLSSKGTVAKRAPAQEEPPAEARRAQGPGVLDRLEAWWTRVRTPAPPPPHPDDLPVLCQLGGKTLFTHKRDCLARGGAVESAGRSSGEPGAGG
jgi:hypothetical protein